MGTSAGVKIEGRERLQVSLADAWRSLNDPAVLRACTPGLSRLDETRADHYEATLELKLPALNGRFEGSVDIVEREEPSRMKMRLEGKGGPGFVNGEAELHLEGEGDATVIRYVADIQVGGQVARLGQRMISGVTKEMAGQFFEALERAASGAASVSGVAPADSGPKPLSAFLALAWRTLLNLLGLSKRS